MNTLTTCANEFILLDHHPDRSRMPEAKPGLVDTENRRATLTWNVFRTLELIAPAFWLRRFHARLGVLTSLESTDQSLSIRLWTALPTPTAPARQKPIGVDVMVETDRAVYGVMTFNGSDLEVDDETLARPDAILRLIDAVSWYAGVRAAYIGPITSDRSDTPIGSALIDCYGGSRGVLLRRLSHRRDELANLRGIGEMTWGDIAAIIRDCAESDSLSELERFAARRTSRWLDSVGIRPKD